MTISESICAWCRLAAQPAVVRRALGMLLVVGAVLIGINHGAALLAGDVDRARWFKMALTPLVPYCVSTVSSVLALRSRSAPREALTRWQAAREPLVVRRALFCMGIVGVVLMSINHGDALVRGEVTWERVLQIGLTLLVPYSVSTLSSVGALRAQAAAVRAATELPASNEAGVRHNMPSGVSTEFGKS